VLLANSPSLQHISLIALCGKDTVYLQPRGNVLELPGGKVEQGETCLQAAYREWNEETNIKLHVPLFHFRSYLVDNTFNKKNNKLVLHVFRSRQDGVDVNLLKNMYTCKLELQEQVIEGSRIIIRDLCLQMEML